MIAYSTKYFKQIRHLVERMKSRSNRVGIAIKLGSSKRKTSAPALY